MSTLKDKLVKDLTFEESRFQQLHLAHQANILVYARIDAREGHSGHSGHSSKTKELARKLRPEFGKLYLASQTQECFKLMRKHDLDDASSAIDVVIMDFDTNSLRLLDMINKRPKLKESAHLALICTVIILPSEEPDTRVGGGGMAGIGGSPSDWQASIDAVGGATAVHPHTVASKNVMSTILDALTRKRSVELAYRDLKATKIKAAKYPFVPLFSSKSANIKGENNDDDDETDDGKFNESSTSTRHVNLEGGGQDSTGGSTVSLKDMDDWTDTNSMLPEFVSTNRAVIEAAKMSLAQEATRGRAASMRSEMEMTGVDKGARFGIRERAIADKNIVRFIQAGGNLKEMQLEAQIAASGTPEDIENNTIISGVTGGAGGDGCEDNLSTSEQNETTGGFGHKDEVGEFTTPRSGAQIESKENLGGDQGASMASSVPPPPLSPPPSSPPTSPGKPGMSKRAMGSILFKSPDIDPGRRTRGAQHLILRERPLELTLLLDPRKRPTWNGPQMQGSTKPLGNDADDAESLVGDASRNPTLDNRSNTSVDNVDLYPFIRRDRDASGVVHTVGGLNKAVATEQWKVIHLSRFEDVGAGSGSVSLGGQLGDGATTLMNEKISAYLSRGDARREDEKLKTTSDHAEPEKEMDIMSQVSGPESLELGTTGRRRTGIDVTIVANATKTLKRMARDTAPDVQLNDLLPIVLASGKVGVGDKDILEQGLKAELEGNYEVAINMYMRAGLHTSKPHLSKMFLAAIRYQMGKFMQAMDDLTWAVESQDKVKHLSIYSKEEHFIAFYNRALVNFRVGNDEKGLEDIRMAISLNEDHLKAREILGLALRRLTKYGESIEISKQNIMIRKEIEQLEHEAELEWASKEAAKARAKEHREKHPFMVDHGRQSIHNHDTLHHSLMSVSSDVEETQTLRQVHCPVEDKGGMGSLKSRKLQRQRQLAQQDKDGSAMLGEALKTFKITNGFHEDLYEGLFTRPSTLQEAMMVHPGSRTPEQVEVIASTLRLFPFLWRCSDSVIKELSRCVEYRALQNRANLYTQNNRADGVVFLLRGSIQGKLDGFDVGATVNHKVVSEIAPYGVIGHIDLLFDTARHPASKDLVESIAAARRLKEDQLNAEFTAAGRVDAKDADSVEDFNHKREDADDASEQELETEMDRLPRCVQNKMFITYTMSSMCEILICKREDFNRLLYEAAYSELKTRLSIVQGCRVFSEWAREDVIRLARMGQMQVFRSGELILKQGVKPNYLSLIMKGMCKSYKSPNKSSVLSVKLADAEAKAARHDLKYTYHHKLRNTLTKGVLVPHPKASEQYKQSLASRTHVTVSEALRYSLGVEIKTLKKELAKAIEAELKQQEEELSLDEAVESATSKLSEVSTLQWPMMFGEACMLDPENGTSRGTIVADTTLEVLSIHKSQLQTFRIRDSVLEKMKYRSVIYPEDEELLLQKERKEQWEYQRQSIVRNLSHPKQEYLEPFYV
jgi:tetratricopeptide (TPR) repeat protein